VAIYVIVILAVVILLFAAYRSLGGSTPGTVDTDALLTSLHAQLRVALDDLCAWVDGDGAQESGSDALRARRRRTAAIQSTLDRLPPPSELDDATAAACAHLASAAEDLTWSWRMAGGAAENPGLVAATRTLRDHATECWVAASGLLRAAAGEPADRV
jgi:hypothetical protein